MRRTILIGVMLGGITLAAFWPVVHNDFISYDDAAYVTENPQVLAGLTWRQAGWAFRTTCSGNWHPLTMLSHLLDVQLFGLKAGGHHLTSLLLHTANTVLLFLLLQRLTGAVGRSALAAALFALHPLHVESVAWVAERKDVLSGFFFMLTLWAYVRYAEGRRKNAECRIPVPQPASSFCLHPSVFYSLALVFFALGLMSKPMLVTVPFVLLLLDYWPLGRMQNAECGMQNKEAGHAPRNTPHAPRPTQYATPSTPTQYSIAPPPYPSAWCWRSSLSSPWPPCRAW